MCVYMCACVRVRVWGVLTWAVSPSHVCLDGRQSPDRQSRGGDPSWEPSNGLTPGVSVEGGIYFSVTHHQRQI